MSACEGPSFLHGQLSLVWLQSTLTCLASRAFLSVTAPWYSSMRRCGAHVCSSDSQLDSTDDGLTIRKGPLMPRDSARYASSEMTWTVLPRPCMRAIFS